MTGILDQVSAVASKGQSTPTRAGRWLPLAAAIGALLVSTAVLMAEAAGRTDGQYTYPLDDTYIGMAVAKNLAQRGVWGVSGNEFSSVTSAPAFTLAIAAGYRITGRNEWWPLALCLLSAVLGLLAADCWLSGVGPGVRAAALTGMVLLAPLNIMTMTGMEHCTHIWLSLWFVRRASQAIERRQFDGWLLALPPVMVLVRYESLFFLGIAAALLGYRRCWGMAAGVLGGGVFGLGVYGAYSVAQGGWWLPNSILLKGSFPVDWTSWVTILANLGLRAIAKALSHPHMAALVAGVGWAVWCLRGRWNRWNRDLVALVIVGLGTVAHLQYAALGWIYRYEAYLLALGIVSLAAAVPALREAVRGRGVGIASLLLLAALVPRAWEATSMIGLRSLQIFEQQRQMARFVGEHYQGQSIGANDIGAIAYFNEPAILDLTGLANGKVLAAKRAHRYSTDTIDQEAKARRVEIAMVYDAWFSRPDWQKAAEGLGGPRLPANWTRVGRWHVDNWEPAHADVSFYAVQPAGIEKLRRALRAFAPTLPSTVKAIEE